eukprot:COSAG04_NODE_28406_length_276_cov_0.564972_1_plen_36_part_01
MPRDCPPNSDWNLLAFVKTSMPMTNEPRHARVQEVI